MTDKQKESYLRGLIAYKYVDEKFYHLRTLKNGKPYLWCPYLYCKRKKAIEYLPYYSEVYADDTKPGHYNIAFGHKDYGDVMAMFRVPAEFVKVYVDDLYGSAQRCSIKKPDGRNQPTTLKQEINRIKIWQDDKFKFAEDIKYFTDVINEVMKHEYSNIES